jgi:sensor histidine kinase YesM
LYFSCINNLANNGNTIHESKGLGIANTKKRLQFLYPGKHILKINSIENNFIVELSISLDD